MASKLFEIVAGSGLCIVVWGFAACVIKFLLCVPCHP